MAEVHPDQRRVLPALTGPAFDQRSRPLRDLRISVTDRCNFRCIYCMPREVFGRDFAVLPRAELLTFEEIARLARAFASQGVSKIRLTGGEPLLRRDLEHLVGMLARVTGITDIAVKVNMVVKRGVNDARIIEMAERFRGSGHILRFIEYMDVGATTRARLSADGKL